MRDQLWSDGGTRAPGLRIAVLALVGAGLLGCRESATSPESGAQVARAALGPATGTFGAEAIISTTSSGNGWEPAVAADPAAADVYAAWMQYYGSKILITYRVSTDGGATWGSPSKLCGSCGGQSQYDVVLATTQAGAVYAVYMQQSRIAFTKSTNHGLTWSTPITVSGGTWADKPWFATSGDGKDVYVTWTTRGNLFAVASHDAGGHFSAPLQLTFTDRSYYFANGGAVLPDGTALFIAAAYPGQGNTNKPTGPVPISVVRTTNRGSSWGVADVDVLYTGLSYATSSVATMASDAGGEVLLVYSGSEQVGAPGKVFVRRSADGGATWTSREEMTTSAGGADATMAAATGRGNGDFRISWMDKRTGGWNVWERESTDAGLTWTADALVSTSTTGAPYKTANGFGMPYEDYHTMAINSAGRTVVVMGEGDNTQTNGDIWANHQ